MIRPKMRTTERTIRQNNEQAQADGACIDLDSAQAVLERQECVRLRYLGLRLKELISEIRAHDPRADWF
jgi:hypothetical protein